MTQGSDRSEYEHMLEGDLFDASDPEIVAGLSRAHELCRRYNTLAESDVRERAAVLDELLPRKGYAATLTGPIFFDFGRNTQLGDAVYANFNFTVLDACSVTIGDHVMFGPNVSLLTPIHPLHWEDRNSRLDEQGSPYDYEHAAPITIGDNCWIAGNVTITGGVTIGPGCVIGAGSVVTRDIPEQTLAAGVPCRPIRQIDDDDRLTLPEDRRALRLQRKTNR